LAGLFSIKNRSAGSLQQILEEYLQLPVKVSQFVGAWFDLPKAECTRLGGKNAILGQTAVIGGSVFQRHSNISIDIGPLSFSEHRQLSGSPRVFAELRKLIYKKIGREFDLSFKVILAEKQKQQSYLSSASLGRNTWLCTKEDTTSKAHVALTI
jgi:type VI secretion system protein ImpH